MIWMTVQTTPCHWGSFSVLKGVKMVGVCFEKKMEVAVYTKDNIIQCKRKAFVLPLMLVRSSSNCVYRTSLRHSLDYVSDLRVSCFSDLFFVYSLFRIRPTSVWWMLGNLCTASSFISGYLLRDFLEPFSEGIAQAVWASFLPKARDIMALVSSDIPHIWASFVKGAHLVFTLAVWYAWRITLTFRLVTFVYMHIKSLFTQYINTAWDR